GDCSNALKRSNVQTFKRSVMQTFQRPRQTAQYSVKTVLFTAMECNTPQYRAPRSRSRRSEWGLFRRLKRSNVQPLGYCERTFSKNARARGSKQRHAIAFTVPTPLPPDGSPTQQA